MRNKKLLMNPFRYIFLIVLSLCAIACANKQPSNDVTTGINDTATSAVIATTADSFPAGKIIEHIICRGDATQSYALYIPPRNEKFTVIYFFDPHGDGALPLKKYKSLADKYNFVLIGSNNSK